MKINLEKYDKWVWRVNGSLLLLACVGAILVCTIVGYKLLKEVFGTRQVHDIVNVDQNTKKEEYLRLGYFHALKGTDLILIPLTSDQKYEASYYSKAAYSRARNYLILNSSNKESYWIWKTNSFLVLEDTKIHTQIRDEKIQKTRGIVFEYVQSDSNSDGALDDKDQKSIQYFDLSSKKEVLVVSQVDRSIGVQQTGDDEVLFFYSRTGKSYFRSLKVSSLRLSEEMEIGLPL
jgi:hypothetical protein